MRISATDSPAADRVPPPGTATGDHIGKKADWSISTPRDVRSYCNRTDTVRYTVDMLMTDISQSTCKSVRSSDGPKRAGTYENQLWISLGSNSSPAGKQTLDYCLSHFAGHLASLSLLILGVFALTVYTLPKVRSFWASATSIAARPLLAHPLAVPVGTSSASAIST